MEKGIIFGCFVIFLALSILSVASVSASYGISLSYWPGKPLRIFPGETKDVELALQNMIGDKDENVVLVLTEGAEIASMKEGSYLVKKKTKDTVIPIKIHVPADVPAGETYKVSVSSQAAPPGGEGVVTLGTSMVTSFDVVTVSEPTLSPSEKKPLTAWIVIGAVLVALVIWYLLRRKKKS